jgi:hypothetical protein
LHARADARLRCFRFAGVLQECVFAEAHLAREAVVVLGPGEASSDGGEVRDGAIGDVGLDVAPREPLSLVVVEVGGETGVFDPAPADGACRVHADEVLLQVLQVVADPRARCVAEFAWVPFEGRLVKVGGGTGEVLFLVVCTELGVACECEFTRGAVVAPRFALLCDGEDIGAAAVDRCGHLFWPVGVL